jgi:hypothetical protein
MSSGPILPQSAKKRTGSHRSKRPAAYDVVKDVAWSLEKAITASIPISAGTAFAVVPIATTYQYFTLWFGLPLIIAGGVACHTWFYNLRRGQNIAGALVMSCFAGLAAFISVGHVSRFLFETCVKEKGVAEIRETLDAAFTDPADPTRKKPWKRGELVDVTVHGKKLTFRIASIHENETDISDVHIPGKKQVSSHYAVAKGEVALPEFRFKGLREKYYSIPLTPRPGPYYASAAAKNLTSACKP